MSAGPEYSRFWFAGQKYKEILARNGVTLRVLTSSGTLENLARLADPASHVDLGFVQSGLTSIQSVVSTDTRQAGLMSLGSVSNWPLFVFYRGPELTRLSEFKGKRLAIGREGSGTRQIVLLLLRANGVEPESNAQMLPLVGDPVGNACQRFSRHLRRGDEGFRFVIEVLIRFRRRGRAGDPPAPTPSAKKAFNRRARRGRWLV
jgi:TRAP-type uncharacterized transport system substrate-binding protein